MNRGLDFSEDAGEAFGVGVGSGAASAAGGGDFRARRPDCAISVDAQLNTKTAAKPAARARKSGE